MKPTLLLFAVIALFAAASPLHAQGGCADSPECPTFVLALVGSSGLGLAMLRGRFTARKKKTTE